MVPGTEGLPFDHMDGLGEDDAGLDAARGDPLFLEFGEGAPLLRLDHIDDRSHIRIFDSLKHFFFLKNRSQAFVR